MEASNELLGAAVVDLALQRHPQDVTVHVTGREGDVQEVGVS